MSVTTTSNPASAQTWAMPPPICPAPIMPMRRSGSSETPATDSGPRSLAALELVGELGKDLEQIADEAVIGDLEDRRFLVFVYRDDDLRSPSFRRGAGWRRKCRPRCKARARRSCRSGRPGSHWAQNRRRPRRARRRPRPRACRRPSPGDGNSPRIACRGRPR